MLSKVFSVIMLLSFITAIFTGNIQRMSSELIASFDDGVKLCSSLLGMMCFWNGIMNVLGNAGFLSIIGKLIEKPLLIIFNKKDLTSKDINNLSISFAADFLGLGNAALPFGIAAMKSLNKGKEYATDNAIMHAVLNTVPIQLIPSTLIALRSNNGSKDPFDVIPYIWLCSLIITVFAVITCKTLSKLWGKEQNKDG